MKKNVTKQPNTKMEKRKTILLVAGIVFLALLTFRIFWVGTFFSIPAAQHHNYTYFLAIYGLFCVVLAFPDMKKYLIALWVLVLFFFLFSLLSHGTGQEYIANSIIFFSVLTVLPHLKMGRMTAVIFLALYALYALWVVIFANRDRFDYSTPIYLNPNTSAFVCFIAFIIFLAFSTTFQNKLVSWIFVALAAVCVVFQIQFGGRTALIGVVLFVGYFVLRKMFDKTQKKTAALLILLLCIGSIAFTYVYAKILFNWIGKGNLTILGKDLFTGRQEVWAKGFEALRGHWLFGIGNTLQSNYPMHEGKGAPTSLDNQMMGYLVCFGLLTFVAVTALLTALVARLCSSKKTTVAAVLVLWIISFFEAYCFYQTTVSYFCIALFVLRYVDQVKTKRQPDLQKISKTENTPLLSVVVPVYNVAEHLSQCVHSIVSQTYENIEIILVNDGSTDGSGKVCKNLATMDSRIRVLQKRNGGVASARNAGLQLAQGEWIAFVDGDDYLELDTYAKMMAKAQMGVDIVFCRFQKEYGDSVVPYYEINLKKVAKKPQNISSLFEYSYAKEADKEVTNNTHGSVCRSLFKKQILDQTGLRFEEDMPLREDKLFLLGYLNTCKKGGLVDEYLYHYRANRAESAITTYSKNARRYYQRQKASMNRFAQAICDNTLLNQKEKENLCFKERYDICFSYLIKTIKGGWDEQTEKACREDAFLQETFAQATLGKMLFSGVSLQRMALTVFIRKKKYAQLKRIVKFVG